MSQLELFKTKEQEGRLQGAIARFAENQIAYETRFDQMRTEFFQAGMIEGKHFTIEGKGWINVDKDFNYGDYRESKYETVNVKAFDKSIKIKAKRYDSHNNEVKDLTSTPDFEPSGYRSTAKFNCYWLQGNSRFVKAATLKDKIEESWTRANLEFKAKNKRNANFIEGIKQLEEQFPTATVSRWTDNKVNVNFPSGSYMRVRVLGWNDEIDFRVDFKYDVVTQGLNMNDLGAHFAAQPSK